MTRILLVEDEERLARSLMVGLRDEEYVVDHARDGEEALWLASAGHHDLILLDLRIPKISGIDVCQKIRLDGCVIPILMLTACDSKEDIVRGLDVGADDYVTKPFDFEELLARIRAMLRRGAPTKSERLRVADLEMDIGERRVWRGGEEIPLSNMEFRVLEHLLRNAGRVQSKSRIAAAVWDDELGPDSNVLEVLVSNLRRKLDRQVDRSLLHTRRGAGYLLTDSVS